MTDYRESITSKLCAFARGWHSEKARDKIFDDYLAVDFMGEKERYFKGRTDGLSAFENVSMLSAVYTGGTSY